MKGISLPVESVSSQDNICNIYSSSVPLLLHAYLPSTSGLQISHLMALPHCFKRNTGGESARQVTASRKLVLGPGVGTSVQFVVCDPARMVQRTASSAPPFVDLNRQRVRQETQS